MRQDLYHLNNCFSELYSWSPGLKAQRGFSYLLHIMLYVQAGCTSCFCASNGTHQEGEEGDAATSARVYHSMLAFWEYSRMTQAEVDSKEVEWYVSRN